LIVLEHRQQRRLLAIVIDQCFIADVMY
jgi:hypothetical protein